jgi:hypothetical protein
MSNFNFHLQRATGCLLLAAAVGVLPLNYAMTFV